MRGAHSVFDRALMPALVVAALFVWPLAAMAATSLPPARDLAADAKLVASSGTPLIVLVSLPGCPHCDMVRRSHLLPLLSEGVENAPAHRPLIRQVEINGKERFKDFSGKSITHADFAKRHKAKLAPVVMFFGAGGEMLVEPLVGAMIPDFYGAYFETALAEARSRLQAGKGR